MHPLVRDLCKRFVLAARRHPSGERFVKDKAMEAFRQNAALKDEIEIKRAVARGRRVVRDIEALSRLSKYRAMRRRY
ncbi:unnamed protein product, partial [Sphacelaria rigidula]